MRAYDLTVTGSLVVSGSTTLTGDITYDDVSATGDIVSTGANKVISGSSTSTGSFGHAIIGGHLKPTTSGSYDLGSADKPWRDLHILSSSIRMYDTTGQIAKLGAIRGKGFKFADNAGALTSISGSKMKLSDFAHIGGNIISTKANGVISGSSTSTGSFGRVEATTIGGTLSTAAQTNITSVGTIGTGTWEGTTVAVDQGGTGVTTSTGTGNVVLSASPTFTGTVIAAAGTFSGNVSGSLTSTGSFGNITKNCSQQIDISRDFAHFGISFLVKSSRPSWGQNPPRPSPETVSRQPFCCCGNTLCICGDRKKYPATIGLTKSVFQLVFVMRNL